ncbi:ABC transporter ATP-binding protein [Mangrovicoccus sp. HB161399]|uniref:ABC transporter ATP-binding protein n=1 Tax=Mangrovicoccus sp. HB161399 TaxID=2720392 RepID=UPI001553DA60|nr:ABC transporter ATP-binding protein [Mangrovicoccus sp. HB161399]
MLEVEGLVAGYASAERILKGVSVHVEPGELVTLVGPNGAGKSTLLKVVSGLVPAREGHVRLGGADVTRQGAAERARAGFAFVMQERNVFGTLTVAENLELAWPGPSRQMAEERARMYGRYPVLAEKRRALARTLSGGQRQILAMAMALMTAPKMLLLDEPTAGLSPKATEELFEVVLGLRDLGLPILMVEQHALEALEVSSRGYVLVSGSNAAEGGGPDLAADPEIRRLFLGG